MEQIQEKKLALAHEQENEQNERIKLRNERKAKKEWLKDAAFPN